MSDLALDTQSDARISGKPYTMTRKTAPKRPPIHMIDTEADTLADLAIGVRDRLPQVSELLLEEISRATIHHAGKIPHNVITMNAEVEFVDEASEATRIVQLVYPRQADIAANRISILTPVGAGLIGLREGQIGRASCRERVWKYVEISVVAVSLKKKN